MLVVNLVPTGLVVVRLPCVPKALRAACGSRGVFPFARRCTSRIYFNRAFLLLGAACWFLADVSRQTDLRPCDAPPSCPPLVLGVDPQWLLPACLTGEVALHRPLHCGWVSVLVVSLVCASVALGCPPMPGGWFKCGRLVLSKRSDIAPAPCFQNRPQASARCLDL